jgi:hypothetical protein
MNVSLVVKSEAPFSLDQGSIIESNLPIHVVGEKSQITSSQGSIKTDVLVSNGGTLEVSYELNIEGVLFLNKTSRLRVLSKPNIAQQKAPLTTKFLVLDGPNIFINSDEEFGPIISFNGGSRVGTFGWIQIYGYPSHYLVYHEDNISVEKNDNPPLPVQTPVSPPESTAIPVDQPKANEPNGGVNADNNSNAVTAVYVLGSLLALTVIALIVLISLYTKAKKKQDYISLH